MTLKNFKLPLPRERRSLPFLMMVKSNGFIVVLTVDDDDDEDPDT